MEIAELVFATVMLSSMFVIAYQWNFVLSVLIGASGLMIHEMGHKIVGRLRCISDVHFSLSPLGIAMGFATALTVGHALAAPGGVTVGDDAPTRDRLWMALAGPAANVLMFLLFGTLHLVSPFVWESQIGTTSSVNVWLAIAGVNIYLAFFNLIPIPMFDGSHILRYSKFVWVLSIGLTGLLLWLSFGTLVETLGPLFRGTWGGVVGMIASGDIPLLPLFPGFMLMHGRELRAPDWLVRCAVDREFLDL